VDCDFSFVGMAGHCGIGSLGDEVALDQCVWGDDEKSINGAPSIYDFGND
jgi:hypothetical protein